MNDLLFLAFIFLCAGVVAVPLAVRLGLGSVLGYLIAGIAISPTLHWLHVDIVGIQHFAEFGVVMMLFLIGLELEPRILWKMRTQLMGLGGGQVVLTTLAVTLCAWLLGQPLAVALAIGLIFSLSSTAIVLQTLNEKGWMKSDGGKAGFAVLLTQDIAVIPMLAFLPLLAASGMGMPEASGHGGDAGHGGFSLVDGLNGWQRTLVTLAVLGFLVMAGRRLTRPVFRFVAAADLRELFTATALMMVVGIAVLMTLVGLSPALGTFMAGVVLANSEYRHQLETDINPFRGLLLGLFFMSVGAGIDFGLLSSAWLSTIVLTLGLMALKALILLGLAVLFGVRGSHRSLLTLGLAQAGEFGFVLLSFATASHVIPDALADRLLLIVALSMLLTPLLFILHEKVIMPWLTPQTDRKADTIEEQAQIIIAGHGRFGGVVNRMLEGAGFSTTVIEFSAVQLDMLRAFDVRAYFGDATQPDMLHAAGLQDAQMLVIAMDDREQITRLAGYVRQHHPHIHVVARARDRHHVYDLYAVGCDDIIRETFDSAVRAGRSAFEALGIPKDRAQQMADGFIDDDQVTMIALADAHKPGLPNPENPAYLVKAREIRLLQEMELSGGQGEFGQLRRKLTELGQNPEDTLIRHRQERTERLDNRDRDMTF